jgi:hypothetical protein
MQRDTLLCFNDTKFSFLLVTETVEVFSVGSSEQHIGDFSLAGESFSSGILLLKSTRLLAIVLFVGFVIETETCERVPFRWTPVIGF